MKRIFTSLLAAPIHIYRYVVSPLLGPNCRYSPTCSAYALDALQVHGPAKGTWLAIKRIARCHPWGGHGYDPVPASCGHHHNETGRDGDTPAHEQTPHVSAR